MMRTAVALLVVALTGVASADDAPACRNIGFIAGSGCFVFTDWSGPSLDVWYHAAASARDEGEIVFVMHGVLRDADRYRDQWAEAADRSGFVVLVPRFSRDSFPGAAGYNLGGLTTDGPRAFDAIEPIYRHVATLLGRDDSGGYYLYGHSAGAQFVHRFVLFADAPRLKAAIAANSGWYTMPDDSVPFPYGLGGPAGEFARTARALDVPLVIALGELDNNPDARYLRTTPEANAQGAHRLARGLRFFETAQRVAASNGTAFNWQLERVPDAGHDNAAMLTAAVRWITQFEERQ